MKNTSYFILIIILISCSSNNYKQEERKIEANAIMLKKIITEDTESASHDSINEKWAAKIKDTPGCSFVYLINSECSLCIEDYVKFLQAVGEIDEQQISVYGILNVNHKALLEYYLNEFNVNNSGKNTLILCEEPYPFSNNDDCSKNVIMYCNGKEIRRIGFSNNTFIHKSATY